MAEKQLQAAKSGVSPVNNQKQRHIKIRVPIALRVALPLLATIIMFQGCAGNAQEQAKKKGGDSVLVFQTSGQAFKTDETKTKAVSQDTLKLTPVKTGKELDSLDAEIDRRMSDILKKIPPSRFVAPGIFEEVHMDKDDLRKASILSSFTSAIIYIKQGKVSEAKKQLTSAETKMSAEEKKTDAVYLKLKAVLDEGIGKTSSPELGKISKSELDSLAREIEQREDTLSHKRMDELRKNTIFSPLGDKRPPLNEEDSRKNSVLMTFGWTIRFIKEGKIDEARKELARAEAAMTTEEKQTDKVYLRLKAALRD